MLLVLLRVLPAGYGGRGGGGPYHGGGVESRKPGTYIHVRIVYIVVV